MEIVYKNIAKNNLSDFQLRSMQELDNLMFEDSYKALGTLVPSCAVLAYHGKDTFAKLVGKVNINVYASAYGSQNITRARISNLAVLPVFQNQGIGKTLMQKSLKVCKLNNIDYAYLNIDLNQKYSKQLVDFYLKFGFIPTVSADLLDSQTITMICPVSEKFKIPTIEQDLAKAIKNKKR